MVDAVKGDVKKATIFSYILNEKLSYWHPEKPRGRTISSIDGQAGTSRGNISGHINTQCGGEGDGIHSQRIRYHVDHQARRLRKYHNPPIFPDDQHDERYQGDFHRSSKCHVGFTIADLPMRAVESIGELVMRWPHLRDLCFEEADSPKVDLPIECSVPEAH
ncbi:unnamed protein product [Echinostoma caproni]|uniref:Transposase n=1 Tax=Echinostoma caproni TaxID=27848 RepID=A0A183BD94_9TREM|nr:unnamed protein product [Echinostoma caproni]